MWMMLPAAYVLLLWLTPFVPVAREWTMWGTVLITLLFMSLQVALVFALVRGGHWSWGLLMLLGGIVCVVGFEYLRHTLGWFPRLARGETPPWLIWQALYSATLNLLITAAAVGLGRLLAMLIREPNLLAPVVPFAAVVDVMTVFAPGGFVKQTLERAPEVVQKVSVTLPQLGSAAAFSRVMPMVFIGVGDFIFMALYAACLYKFAIKPMPTLVGFILVLTLYMGLILFVPGVWKLPALVPMAAVFMLINWRHFKLTPSEKTASVVVTLCATAVIAWLFWK
jgi:hypothetical protein